MPSAPPPVDRAGCESSHPGADGPPLDGAVPSGPPWSDDARREHPTPRPAPPRPPPVVGGRFAPIMGMRRNVVDYAESMWRRHGDLVHMVLGPPGPSREVWRLHHPDGAARVLSGSSWRAFAKHDQVYDEIARWLGPGLLTAEGEDWTRQKRFVQPLFTKVAVEGYADLMVDEIEPVVGEWDDRPAHHVDLGEQMQRLTLRVVLRALFGDSADDVCPTCGTSFPVVSDTIMRRGLGALRLPTGIPTRRVRRGRAARDDLFGVCDGHRRGAPRGAHDRRDRPAEPADRRARRRRAALRRGGARPGARLHARRARDDLDGADLRAAPARPPPGRAGRACEPRCARWSATGTRPRPTAARLPADDRRAEGGHAALPVGAVHRPAHRARTTS